MHRLVPMVFTVEGQDAANGVHEFDVPVGITILGVSLCAEAFTGTPTGFNIDIQDDGSDVITAVAANTAGTPGTWCTPALGGSQTPVHIAAGSDVEIDVNFSGGSSPTADYTIVLYVTLDEV
jgi:hypothetical protein